MDKNIVIYKSDDGQANIDVKLENETVWLDIYKIAELFERDRTVILKHIKNIYKTNELPEASTCAKNAQVQIEGNRKVVRSIDYYNLDMIISIGYRVNSKRGTEFRIWATNILKQHLVNGYTKNKKRLDELKKSVKLINSVLENYAVTNDESKALVKIVSDYTYALDLLDDYDYQRVEIGEITDKTTYRITYDEIRCVIAKLKEKFVTGNLFGQEKDGSVHSCINTIYQTFGKTDLYPSLEEKASNLFYFLIKNHPFIDGNKRIAAFLFIWFLDKNNYLYDVSGKKRIADNALVALTLMVAESKADEKNIIIKIIINLINKNN